MLGIARGASIVLLSTLLAACGESTAPSPGGGSGEAGSGASSSSGGTPGAPIVWTALPDEGAPSARYLHTATWTGSKMIVWGGRVDGTPPVTATGGVYDPEAKTWTPTSTQGAPSPRHSHTAVWTGSGLIIWGGYGESDLAKDGALYDPESDTWKPISTANQPAPRSRHSAIWSANTLIVWGGDVVGKAVASGGIYDPATDTWKPTSDQGAPGGRFSHSAVWSGTRMIVWGGTNLFDWLNDGKLFDPAQGESGAWTSATPSSGAPSVREDHAAVFASPRMLIWGGWTGGPYEDTGAIFDPGDPSAGEPGAWTAMTKTGAPSPRADHIGVPAAGDLLVWGGCGEDTCATIHGDGGRFTPDADGGRWTPIEEQSALPARRGHTAVATPTSVIVWGGRDAASNPLATGAEADY